jgi:aspartyl/asparaginyl beta-hydroxylase (cupin superfamily)
MAALSPELVRDVNRAAMRAMSAGDFAGAREMLQKTLQSARDATPLWLNLAACCRALGDLGGAMAAVDGALRTDPRSFMALLMKGLVFEQQGVPKEAARYYGFAVALEPPEQTLDAATQRTLRHAREVHRRYEEELVAFVAERIGPVREKGSSVESRRIGKFMDYTLRRKSIYRQDPTDFFYPGLPSIEFYDREECPWLEGLEAATADIRKELEQILRDDFRDFVPYVTYPDHVPLDQWAELNRSTRWGALHLYLSGDPVEKNCSRCPQTMAALSAVPQPRMPGRSPAAMFSALQPKTRIPPHTGAANTRLVTHLPLIVPEGCGFRVGGETRSWREGQAWTFDDTIEHEAWNESELPRVIFICDVWNPRLSLTERELICSVIAARDAYNGYTPRTEL